MSIHIFFLVKLNQKNPPPTHQRFFFKFSHELGDLKKGMESQCIILICFQPTTSTNNTNTTRKSKISKEN